MKKYLLFLSLTIATTAIDSVAMLTKIISSKKIPKQTYRFNSTQIKSQSDNHSDQTKTDHQLNLIKILLDIKSIPTHTNFEYYNKNAMYDDGLFLHNLLGKLAIESHRSLDTIKHVKQNLQTTNLTTQTQNTLLTNLNDLKTNITNNTYSLSSFNTCVYNNKQKYSHTYSKKLAKYFFIRSPQFNAFTKRITSDYILAEHAKQNCLDLIDQDIEANKLLQNKTNNQKNDIE